MKTGLCLMAPLSGLHQSSLPSDFEAPARLPPLDRGLSSGSSPRRPRQLDSRSRSRKGRRTWKKLLWVKQSCLCSPSSHIIVKNTLNPIHFVAFASHLLSVSFLPSTSTHGGVVAAAAAAASSVNSDVDISRHSRLTHRNKQTDPDNYTDQATFLDNLQRNPRLQPYEFWPLVADSTVIVQHVCSVIIFVVCFIGIFQERVSPVSVVSWSSFATFIGWCLCDWWVGQEAMEDADEGGLRAFAAAGESSLLGHPPRSRDSATAGVLLGGSSNKSLHIGVDKVVPDAEALSTANSSSHQLGAPSSERPRLIVAGGSNTDPVASYPHSASASSLLSAMSQTSRLGMSRRSEPLGGPKHRPSSPLRGGRAHLRVNAMKSALLIYFTLLGLSPILKSLTRSTSSDSIWAMSFWLLAVNIFFFDYSATWVGVNNISVASLSTNAALMASTVLASRLPSTGQVFGLTLFSIEVFGLFPVFRRYARHRSWRFHVLLTILLVLGAGVGVGMTLSGHPVNGVWPWRSGLLGMMVACIIAAVAMGGCSWWLLGLQKYKNEIYGPWDPARPVIISRRHWDVE